MNVSVKIETMNDTLVQELLNFKVEIAMGGHDKYEAWRGGVHDDLVLSAAMACWYGERKPLLGYGGGFEPILSPNMAKGTVRIRFFVNCMEQK